MERVRTILSSCSNQRYRLTRRLSGLRGLVKSSSIWPVGQIRENPIPDPRYVHLPPGWSLLRSRGFFFERMPDIQVFFIRYFRWLFRGHYWHYALSELSLPAELGQIRLDSGTVRLLASPRQPGEVKMGHRAEFISRSCRV